MERLMTRSPISVLVCFICNFCIIFEENYISLESFFAINCFYSKFLNPTIQSVMRAINGYSSLFTYSLQSHYKRDKTASLLFQNLFMIGATIITSILINSYFFYLRFIDYGTFDFIIIGSGSTGSVLTNRLSSNNSWKILLLEAGSMDSSFTDIPSMYQYSLRSKYNWGYNTTSQKYGCKGMNNGQNTGNILILRLFQQ